MALRWHALAPVIAPSVTVVALGALDLGFGESVSAGGVVLGMALMALLTGLVAVIHRPMAPLRLAAAAALRSATEAAIGVVLVFALAAPLTLLLPRAWVARLMVDDRATDLIVTLLLGVAMLVASRAMHRASREAARVAEAQRDAALTRADLAHRDRELARAELQVLRAQVEPHFLWNTLANVEYLIRTDAPRAHAMMGHLIAYLRSSVAAGHDGDCTVGSEADSVRAYLGLMQTRMGERLLFSVRVDPECADVPFAPLLLQTLVENAIKHGLEPLPGQARLEVSAALSTDDAGLVVLSVTDNGVGLQADPATRGTGLGLRSVRERLLAMRGVAATLTVQGQAGGGVRAQMLWPVEIGQAGKWEQAR